MTAKYKVPFFLLITCPQKCLCTPLLRIIDVMLQNVIKLSRLFKNRVFERSKRRDYALWRLNLEQNSFSLVRCLRLPAHSRTKKPTVSHARMQNRPSDSSEQKVGRGRVSVERLPRSICQEAATKGGVEGALLVAIQRQFVSLAVEVRPKTCEQLEPCGD